MKKYSAGLIPISFVYWSQLAAGVGLLPLILRSAVRRELSPPVVGNVLGLALLCSAVAYLLYYRLIADVGPTRALTVAFLMPMFGMAWGALFLGETITWPMIVGCALIVAGTTAVLRPGTRR